MKKHLILNPSFLILIAFWSISSGFAYGGKKADISYEIIIDNPSAGIIKVAIDISGLSQKDLILTENASYSRMMINNLKAKNKQGIFLTVNTLEKTDKENNKQGKREFVIEANGDRNITVEYDVKPGNIARHGHQGYLDGRFGLVSGRNIFLFPSRPSSVGKVSVEFKLPSNWQVVSPWHGKTGENNFILSENDYKYKVNLRDILWEATLGFGRFKMRHMRVNGFDLYVHVPFDWPEERLRTITEHASGILKYQLELFGVNMKWEYTLIFVPKAADGGRVFGGCRALGQGFEMDPANVRNWELLSHRINHLFNSYEPFAMYMAQRPDRWFVEATASYFEIKSVASLGDYKLEDRLKDYLFRRYKALKVCRDARLSSDYKQPYKTREYLHYAKGPLVAYLMDKKIMNDTRGAKDLNAFMKYLYAKYGIKRGLINNLKLELETFTGIDFSEFFKKYVDGVESIVLDN